MAVSETPSPTPRRDETPQPALPAVFSPNTVAPSPTPTALALPLSADLHPAAVYLAELGASSRATLRKDLEIIARILGSDAWSCPWHLVRFQHVALVRSTLQEHYAPSTANKMLSALRGVLRAASRLGLMPAEEYARAADIKPIRGTTLPAGRALSRDEVGALLDACREEGGAAGARDGALIATLYTCGLRRAEAAGLDVEDWRQAEGTLVVRHGKGRKQREVPLLAATVAALRTWLASRGEEPGALFCPVYPPVSVKPSRRLTPQAIFAILSRRAAQAGVEDLSPHDLRRTFITDLLERGADIGLAQDLAGHAKTDTTRRYDRRGEAARRRAIELLQLPGADGPE